MLFYCEYEANGEKGCRIFDVLNLDDLHLHCYQYKLEITLSSQITYTEDNSDLFQHKKGGIYTIAGYPTPAGDEARDVGCIIVYKDIVSGSHYYRPWRNFQASMKRVNGDEIASKINKQS